MNVCLLCTITSYGKETIRRLSDVLWFHETFALKIYDVGTVGFFFCISLSFDYTFNCL